MSRDRVRLIAFAMMIATIVAGLFAWRSLARPPVPPRYEAARSSASSDAGPAKRKRPTARRGGLLVSPRGDAERSEGAASITGRVVDDVSRRGVPNASLTFLSAGKAVGADAASDGSFTLQGLAPGVYELYAISASGYAPFESAHGGIVLRVDPDTRLRDVTFSLRALWLVEGTVTDPTGAPVAGAKVTGLEAGAEWPATDAEGHFSIDCSLGESIEARHERFAPGRAACDRAAQLGRPISIRLGQPGPTAAGGVISGRVVDVNGRGIAGASVSAERREPRSAGPVAEIASAENGDFSIDALEDGSYDVTATAAGFATSVQTRVKPGGPPLSFRLVTGSRLIGLVRERSSGKPVVGFSIVLWPVRLLERGPPTVRTFFAPDGRFAIDALAPGEYAVTALSAGWPAPDERRFTLGPGVTQEMSFELTPGGRVHGTVSDSATGKPLAGARVALESIVGEERSAVPLLAGDESDERGAFELQGIGGGRFTLSVTAVEHHHKLLSGLEVRTGGSLGPLRIDLDPTAPGEAPKLELQGIGAVLRVEGDAVVVAEVVPDGGAARAGIVPGDRILEVDGIRVTTLGFKGTIEQIRGPEGTAVRLRIRRGETETHVVAERRRVRR